MSNIRRLPPEELVRLAYIGKRYFKDGRSRIEIGEELEISRFKVARLIQRALDTGIVRIDISQPGPIDVELSVALTEKFKLKTALAVVTPVSSAEEIRRSLGAVVADLLSEIVTEGDTIGLSAGRTLIEMSRCMTSIACCDVIQLTGVADPVRERGVEAVSTISRLSGGTMYSLLAPLVASDVEATAIFERQLGVQRTLRRMSFVTKAIVTIGSWPGDSLLHDSLAASGDAARLVASGVCAEIGATLLTRSGEVVDALGGRSIGITTEQLRAVPHVIGVGGGSAKLEAIGAVLRSGILSTLVTDAQSARRLVAG